MKLRRRTFLKSSLAASVTASLASRLPAAPAGFSAAGREFYELRAYRLKPGAPRGAIDAYLEKALIPALDKRGIKNVGAFTELDVNKTTATATPKADTPLWVFIPYASLDAFVGVTADINNDPAVQKAGGEYLNVPKASPAFERIDSWLLLAFQGMPKMQLPAFSKSAPNRVFEMRDYESHSELKALSKVAMFNAGEIEIMKTLGMSPVFFGQALAGPNLPHLRYITCAADLATHLANWKKFGPDPRWEKLKVRPEFQDNTSKNTSRFLAPTPYSQV